LSKIATVLLAAALVCVALAWAPLAAAQEAAAPPAAEGSALEADGALEDEGRTLADWFGLGGNIMWVLVVFSMISVTLIIERMWALRRGAIIPRGFLVKLSEFAQRREFKPVLELCAGQESAIARVLRAGLVHFDDGLARMEDAVETAGAHEASMLRKNLPLLAAIGNMATMVGLLGTVLGMITSFELIAKMGTGDASVVAEGIFQALVTTAAGLIVGLFAVGCHSFLRRKVEVLEIDLEEKSFRTLEDLWLGRDEPHSEAELTPQEA
jgi:biopolymer transport protein ExbB